MRKRKVIPTGLDCMPHTYPCVKAGTEVRTPIDNGEGGIRMAIDCEATMAAAGCPWEPAAVGHGHPVTGMFGTPCWFRGKVGTWMLDALAKKGWDDAPGGVEGFYGYDDHGDDDEPNLSPEHCVELSAWMTDHMEAYVSTLASDLSQAERVEDLEIYRYAAWWLGWVAQAGDGADAWY